MNTKSQTVRYAIGWLLVRPRRWLFWRMVWATDLQLLPQRCEWAGWRWPNPHWWILYKTLFNLCKWLDWEAWRPLCRWEKNRLAHKPWYARLIQRIGETTAGYAISGGECHHCASKEGCQVELSDDETGKMFRLERAWTVGTQDGTDHRFSGITICPKCGFESDYEDGSL